MAGGYSVVWGKEARVTDKRFGELQNAIVVAGDLSGGFHLLKLEVWEDIARAVCKDEPEYLPRLLARLREADERRRELNARKYHPVHHPFVYPSRCHRETDVLGPRPALRSHGGYQLPREPAAGWGSLVIY